MTDTLDDPRYGFHKHEHERLLEGAKSSLSVISRIIETKEPGPSLERLKHVKTRFETRIAELEAEEVTP